MNEKQLEKAKAESYDEIVQAETARHALIALVRNKWLVKYKNEPPETARPTNENMISFIEQCVIEPFRRGGNKFTPEILAAQHTVTLPFADADSNEIAPEVAAHWHAHRAWVDKLNPRGQHPWGELVAPWLEHHGRKIAARKIDQDTDTKRPASIMHSRLGTARDLVADPALDGVIPQREPPESIDQVGQFLIPGTERPRIIRPMQTLLRPTTYLERQGALFNVDVKPLIRKTTKAGAVPMSLRLYYEILMQTELNEAEQKFDIELGDLIKFLNPYGKWDRKRMLPRLIRGLEELSTLRVPYSDGPRGSGDWAPILLRNLPNMQSPNETVLQMDVKLPPDVVSGMMVMKRPLRWTGKKLAILFNAYLAACDIFDRFGTQKGSLIDPTRPIEIRNEEGELLTPSGQPIRTEARGAPVKNLYHTDAIKQLPRERNPATDRYPILDDNNLLWACYPDFDVETQPGAIRRNYLARAKKAWRTLRDQGFVDIEETPRGWRILPCPDHVNKHRAIKHAGK